MSDLSAYERAAAQRLALKQAEQRQLPPKQVAQRLLWEFCGRAGGFGVAMDVLGGAELVRLVEAIHAYPVNAHKC